MPESYDFFEKEQQGPGTFDGYEDVEEKFLYKMDLGAAIGGTIDEKNGKKPEPMNDYFLTIDGGQDWERAKEGLEKYSTIMETNETRKAVDRLGLRKKESDRVVRVRPSGYGALLEMARKLEFVNLICEYDTRRFAVTPKD